MSVKRIPRFLPLPGPGEESFILRIQLVKDGTLAAIPGEPVNAEYESDSQTIKLPKSGARGRRLFLLYHELGHALEDYRLWLLQQLDEDRAK